MQIIFQCIAERAVDDLNKKGLVEKFLCMSFIYYTLSIHEGGPISKKT